MYIKRQNVEHKIQDNCHFEMFWSEHIYRCNMFSAVQVLFLIVSWTFIILF